MEEDPLEIPGESRRSRTKEAQGSVESKHGKLVKKYISYFVTKSYSNKKTQKNMNGLILYKYAHYGQESHLQPQVAYRKFPLAPQDKLSVGRDTCASNGDENYHL